MRTIISASRRTDIPAFYTDWFMRRLREGYLFVRHPYSGRVIRVSLRPEDVHSIVFWTKNPSPLIPRLPELERTIKDIFFHFTITTLPRYLEPESPHWRDAIKDLVYLSRRYSPEHIIWRFDPIVVTDSLPLEYYREAFTRCAELLRGHITACYTSFVNVYRKVRRNFPVNTPHGLLDITDEEKRNFARTLGTIAERFGFRLYACCNDILLSDKVYKGSCIDGRRLASITGTKDLSCEPAPTRKECLCTKSTDIGAYDTCPGGCRYCYANTNRELALESYMMHNPGWNGLGFNIDKDQYKKALRKDDQQESLLFDEQ